MDHNNCQTQWWIPFAPQPIFDADHVQSLMTSKTPEYPVNHQEPAFAFPARPSAPPLRQNNYPQGQQQQQIFISPDVFQQEAPNSPILELEAEKARYESDMKKVFQGIIEGRLVEAGESLLGASEWLFSHIEIFGKHLNLLFDIKPNSSLPKGLTVDDVSRYDERMLLWKDYNTAWLGLFQKQRDMLEAGQQMQHAQSLMTQESIETMVTYLIRKCDTVEKYGLVDYEQGVQEERIVLGNPLTLPYSIVLS
jgi:hypothetical protein